MRKYYEYIKNSFKEYLAYRVEYFTGITQTLLALLVQLYLWRALLGQSGQASTDTGVITLGDMTTYVLVATLLATLTSNNIIYDIVDRIRTGQISTDLIRPMNFTAYMFCRMVGGSLFNFLFRLIPVLVIGMIFLDFQFPSIPNLIFFCVTVVNAVIIMFLVTFSLGMLSFWYMAMWQVDVLLGSAIALFSGRLIPLWFFPKVLVSISSFLPFRLIYFVPISVYLGKVEIIDCWYSVLQQVIWIVILYTVTRLMWHGAVKKLVIQGG